MWVFYFRTKVLLHHMNVNLIQRTPKGHDACTNTNGAGNVYLYISRVKDHRKQPFDCIGNICKGTRRTWFGF
eukprot:UN04239